MMPKFGTIDAAGRWVTEPRYLYLGPRSCGMHSVAYPSGNQGYLCADGTEIFIPDAVRTHAISSKTGYGSVEFKDELYCIIDLAGRQLSGHKYASLSNTDLGHFYAFKEVAGSSAGVLDASEKWIVPPAYQTIEQTGHWGYMGVNYVDETSLALIEVNDNAWKFICEWYNCRGVRIRPDLIIRGFIEGEDPLIVITHETTDGGCEVGLFDLTGNQLKNIPEDIAFCGGYCNGLAPACHLSDLDKQGYVDAQFKWIVEPKFDEASKFTPNGLATVWRKKSAA